MCRSDIISTVLIGAAGLAVLAVPAAGQQLAPVPVAPGEVPRRGAAIENFRRLPAPGLSGITVPVLPALRDRELAGLSEHVPAESLTWQRVYALALVHARDGRNPPLADSLDPAALAEQAQRLGVADFARFRKEFLAGRTDKGATFHDPAGAYLSLLRRVQRINLLRHLGARHENLIKLTQELVQGQSSGLSQLDVDSITSRLIGARAQRWREVAAFRNALDDLKPVLGLSPRAAVALDRSSLAAFDNVFQQVDMWQFRPDRHLADLPRIVDQLPALGEVIVNGRPVPVLTDDAAVRQDGVLKAAADEAMRNHAASGRTDSEKAVALELRVRRRVRRLLELRGEYDSAKQMYVLGVRLGDQAFERIQTPSSAARALARDSSTVAIVNAFDRSFVAQDRLVTAWIDFRAERLELYRDLGSLPCGNWDAFYASLAAPAPAQLEPKPAPRVLEPAVAPPPAPPETAPVPTTISPARP